MIVNSAWTTPLGKHIQGGRDCLPQPRNGRDNGTDLGHEVEDEMLEKPARSARRPLLATAQRTRRGHARPPWTGWTGGAGAVGARGLPEHASDCI